MATQSRSSHPDLDRPVPAGLEEIYRLLRRVPQEFEFFQVVRWLCLLQPDKKVPGRFAKPGEEAMRFRAHASLPFPASQVQNIVWPEAQPPAVIVNFMGLHGPSGVLPIHYTEMIVERARAKDRAIAEFFDLFNHRMIALFYQAWEKYRFGVAHERGDEEGLRQLLMHLIGLGTPRLQNRLRVNDEGLIFYSGLLAMKTRPAVGLRHLLEDYFGVPVEVEQFVGGWYRIDPQTQSRLLGLSGPSEQLGGGAIVGDEIWSREAAIRLRIGPLSLSEYMDFLPVGSAWRPLQDLVKFYLRDSLDVQVQLILRRDEVPACELGQAAPGPRLGWTSWVKNLPRLNDADDTILQLSRTQ
jgi:type VI secretion system protein ImpH